MATPFQPFWPCQTAWYPASRRAPWGNLSGGLELLEAGDVGPRLGEPAEQHRQPGVHAVYVVRRDLHGGAPPSWDPVRAPYTIEGAQRQIRIASAPAVACQRKVGSDTHS